MSIPADFGAQGSHLTPKARASLPLPPPSCGLTPSPPSERGQSLCEIQCPTIKFVMVGDAAVGKTNIASRFCRDTFDENSSHTIGFEFQSRKLVVTDTLTISAQLWDTAGQERFHSLAGAYFRGAVGIFLCYDITNRKSFESLASWLKKIEDYGERCGTYLAGCCSRKHSSQFPCAARTHLTPFRHHLRPTSRLQRTPTPCARSLGTNSTC